MNINGGSCSISLKPLKQRGLVNEDTNKKRLRQRRRPCLAEQNTARTGQPSCAYGEPTVLRV